MIKKHFLEVLRWGLRLHSFSHFVEVLSAIVEGAFITAFIDENRNLKKLFAN